MNNVLQNSSSSNSNHKVSPCNIWAIGRNYAAHAQEMNVDIPTEPIIFLKSAQTLSFGDKIFLPIDSSEIHYELELAFEIDDKFQPQNMYLAIDLTNRTAQNVAKQKGLPWTLAKSFKHSCPISEPKPTLAWLDLQNYSLELKINQQTRQKSLLNKMIFTPSQMIQYLKHHYPLQAGDLVLTGTPEGVGPLYDQDQLLATLTHATQGVLLQQLWLVEKQKI